MIETAAGPKACRPLAADSRCPRGCRRRGPSRCPRVARRGVRRAKGTDLPRAASGTVTTSLPGACPSDRIWPAPALEPQGLQGMHQAGLAGTSGRQKIAERVAPGRMVPGNARAKDWPRRFAVRYGVGAAPGGVTPVPRGPCALALSAPHWPGRTLVPHKALGAFETPVPRVERGNSAVSCSWQADPLCCQPHSAY